MDGGKKKTLLDRYISAMRGVAYQSGWIAGALSFVMMLAIIREVVGRYFFNTPTDWSVDLNAFLLVGMVYLGSAYTTTIDGHVRADFFYGRVTGRPKAWLDLFIDLICIAYCNILVWEGGLLAWDSFQYGEVSSGGVRWPLFPFQALIPLGAMMVILGILARSLTNVRFLMGKGGPYQPSGGGH